MDKVGLVNVGSRRKVARAPIVGKQKMAIESFVTLVRSNKGRKWKDPGQIIRTMRKNDKTDTLRAGIMNLPLPGRWECSGT